MVIILTSGGHFEFLCMCKNISYDKSNQICFIAMQTIDLIANLNIVLYFQFIAAILAPILNYQSGALKDSKSTKNNYALPNSWFNPFPLYHKRL